MNLKPKYVVPFIWSRTNEVMSAYAEYERMMARRDWL